MRGNSHVRFLGGWVEAIPPGYPARAEGNESGSGGRGCGHCRFPVTRQFGLLTREIGYGKRITQKTLAG